jgi:XPC-binding domain
MALRSVAAVVLLGIRKYFGYFKLFIFLQGATPGVTSAPSSASRSVSSLEFLRNTPQFQTLRQLVQAQPGILQPMLQVGCY